MELRYVTVDCSDPERLAAFWSAALGCAVEGRGGPYVMLGPVGAGGPRLSFQRVPDVTPGKNRLHLDLAGDDPVAEVRRLEGLGASIARRFEEGDSKWTVMRDPEGNEFCVLG